MKKEDIKELTTDELKLRMEEEGDSENQCQVAQGPSREAESEVLPNEPNSAITEEVLSGLTARHSCARQPCHSWFSSSHPSLSCNFSHHGRCFHSS